MSDTLLANVLRALDVAVLERLADSRFQIVGTSPAWLEAAFDEAPAGARHTLGGALPFLDHFLQDADSAWHESGAARADSGPFTATIGGQDALLRATAITVEHRSVLVLERLTGDVESLDAFRRPHFMAEEPAADAMVVDDRDEHETAIL